MGRAPSHKKKAAMVPEWAREQDDFQKKTKYPYCKGTFPDCPAEITEAVDGVCKICPSYKKR